MLNNDKKEIEDHEIVEIDLSELEEIEILPSNNNKR